jgi:glycosyltransferase involved in cell wall biosynthesis
MSRPLRFIFTTTISSSGHTLGSFFEGLAHALVDAGHDVLILTDGGHVDMERRSGNPRILSWPSKRPTRLRDARFLAAVAGEFRPDLIVGNFGSVNVCLLVGRYLNVPHRVIWHHTPSRQAGLDFDNGTMTYRARRQRKKLLYRLATSFITGSAYVKDDLIACYGLKPDSITVLPYLLAQGPAHLRALPRSQRRISFPGRFHPSKGQDVMIRALARVVREFPDLVVDFTGEGPLRPEMEALAASLGVAGHCRFLGFLGSLDEVKALMASAFVSVAMSRDEGFGLVVTEAFSMGTPVIGTTIPPFRETIVDGEVGYLIDVDDDQALADRLLRLLRDPALARAMGDNAMRHFERRFSLECNARRYADYFIDLAGTPAPSREPPPVLR